MKFRNFLYLGLLLSTKWASAQNVVQAANYPKKVERPKLVVGIVIDQMRWDYLYRYYERYGNGGFKRLINDGFSVENTMVPYTPTYTACGHTCIYTGSVPAIHGIISNNWYDPDLGRFTYCTEDKTEKTVGSSSVAGQMSPRNMSVTTITDELRLATNFKSKVIGISLKDRGSILPAGHSANAAYFYDNTGNWITSSYYMSALPKWVKDYNAKQMANAYYKQNWHTLYPLNTYTQSTSDSKTYEGRLGGLGTNVFPHKLDSAINKNYDLIRETPFGNSMTLDIAKVAVEAEKMGQGESTDFLAVSCSSTDYVGHEFGPNSIEAEDTYLRLDKDLGDFFSYLDKKIGKDNYLVFLSADHAAAHVPGFMDEHKLPAGLTAFVPLKAGLDSLLKAKFGLQKSILSLSNNQIYFDQKVIDNAKANLSEVKAATIAYLIRQPGIQDALDMQQIGSAPLPATIKEMLINGHNARRSGDIYFIEKSNWFPGHGTGTTHGSWYPYDAHIPLLFMGWHIQPGKTNKVYHMTDISATLAALLHIQMPSGCIGQPITEITK